jgi:hypothetical protein
MAAMALDPRHKMTYFERQWLSEWVVAAKNRMRRLYNEYRNGEEDADILTQAKSRASSARSKEGEKTGQTALCVTPNCSAMVCWENLMRCTPRAAPIWLSISYCFC